MPRRSKGARLQLKSARRDKAGNVTHRATWIIRDNGRDIGTGCAADEITAAEQALKDYIASKYTPRRKAQDIELIPLGDVLSIYLDAELAALRDRFKVAEDQEETIPGIRKFKKRIGRLNDWWGKDASRYRRRSVPSIREGARQQRRLEARSGGSARSHQPPRCGRLSSRDRQDHVARKGRAPRQMAHEVRCREADLDVLAVPRDAENVAGATKGRKSRNGKTTPTAPGAVHLDWCL